MVGVELGISCTADDVPDRWGGLDRFRCRELGDLLRVVLN